MRQVQEELYQRLLSIRQGLAKSLDSTCSEVESRAASPEAKAIAAAGSAEADELRAENKKLQYRIQHLLKTIEEIEAKPAATQ